MLRQEVAERIAGLLDEILGGIRPAKLPKADDLKITLAQLHCLHTIDDLGSPTMTDVARHMRLQPSTVTAVVDALVACGTVERLEDPADRRIVRVRLTALGRRRRNLHRRERRRRMAQLLAALGDDELRQLESTLERLRQVVLGNRGQPDARTRRKEGK